MEWLFWLMLIVAFVWMIYMATCRPEQWAKICEEDRRRKKEFLGGAMKIGGIAWRAYQRRK